MADVVIPPAPASSSWHESLEGKGNASPEINPSASLQGSAAGQMTAGASQSDAGGIAPQQGAVQAPPPDASHLKRTQLLLDLASEKLLKATCLISLVAWLFAIIILSIMTKASPFMILIGMSPLVLTIIVSYILVDRYHMDSGFLMVFPFIFTGMFVMLGVAGLLGTMDFLLLSTVNLILGVVFEAILVLQHSFIHTRHARNEILAQTAQAAAPVQEAQPAEAAQSINSSQAAIDSTIEKLMLESEADIDKFVASIEDKAKAINAVIGRVYSIRRGGSEALRRKIRVDPEHYNEFNQLRKGHAVRRMALALKILNKIKQRLLVLDMEEAAVFTPVELSMLLNLERNPEGHDKIIEVLARNDSDPVKLFYEGALQFCDKAFKDINEVFEMKKAMPPVISHRPRRVTRARPLTRKRVAKALASRGHARKHRSTRR